MGREQSKEQGNVASTAKIAQCFEELLLHAYMKEKGIPTQGMSPKTYQAYHELVTLLLQKAKKTGYHYCVTERAAFAKEQALKLIRVFKTAPAAKNYLIRNKVTLEGMDFCGDFIVKGCEFTFPESPDFDLPKWQRYIAKYPPNKSDDLIFKLLAVADKIEKHLQENRVAIEAQVADQVREDYESRFRKACRVKQKEPVISKTVWLKAAMEDRESSIERLVKKRFNNYLREELGFNGKIKKAYVVALRQRQAHLTAQDEKKLEEIKQAAREEARQKCESEYAKKMAVTADTEEAYVATQMQATLGERRGLIKAKISELYELNLHPQKLLSFVRPVLYPRAPENLTAAELFFSYGFNDVVLNYYLGLTPKNSDSHVPPVLIEGADIASEYKDYYITKLKHDDPRGAILGKMTGCCQYLGGVGEDSAVHGIESQYGGFYVLCQHKEPGCVSDEDDIVAQCWAWRGKGKSLVFDSIEHRLEFYRHNGLLVRDAFMFLAQHLVKEHGIFRVTAGKEGETPGQLCFMNVIHEAESRDYLEYTDADEQCLLAHRHMPTLPLYAHREPNTRLSVADKTELTRRQRHYLRRYLQDEENRNYWLKLLDEEPVEELDLVRMKEKQAFFADFDDYVFKLGYHSWDFYDKAKTYSYLTSGIDASKLHSRERNTLFQQAAKHNDMSAIKLMLEQCRAKLPNDSKTDILISISKEKSLKAFRFCWKRFSPSFTQDELMHFFVRILNGECNAAQRYLWQQPAIVPLRRQILHDVLRGYHHYRYDIYEDILALPNVPLNEPDENGDTALHVACQHVSDVVLRQLVQAGADATLQNDAKKKPYELLAETRFYRAALAKLDPEYVPPPPKPAEDLPRPSFWRSLAVKLHIKKPLVRDWATATVSSSRP